MFNREEALFLMVMEYVYRFFVCVVFALLIRALVVEMQSLIPLILVAVPLVVCRDSVNKWRV